MRTLRDERRPDEEGEPEERHPRRAQVEDRHQEVQRPEDARRAEEDQPEEPEVRVRAQRERLGRERRVAEPPGVRRGAHEPAGVQEEPAEEEDPVGERVEPRESDVPRADHERDQVVEEGDRERHQRQEHHAGPVHGEELVVALGAQELAVGARELEPDQEGLDPGDQEEREGGRAVEETDPLVVDGGEPGGEAAALGGRRRVDRDRDRRGVTVGAVSRAHRGSLSAQGLMGRIRSDGSDRTDPIGRIRPDGLRPVAACGGLSAACGLIGGSGGRPPARRPGRRPGTAPA